MIHSVRGIEKNKKIHYKGQRHSRYPDNMFALATTDMFNKQTNKQTKPVVYDSQVLFFLYSKT
jgi:hypothetical protein